MKSRRALTTVLFTDIVGSTERAAELGDRAWRKLQARHHAVVREELRRWGGREVTEAGDGFLALFDNPARAIVCAHRIRDRVRELGLEIRCGLHMGQAERAPDGSAGGIAVHVGARVAGEAGPGEVFVTSAVRDAEAGSGFAFEDLGPHALKGIDRRWQLFRVTALPDNAAALAPGAWERLRHRVGPRRAAAVGALAAVLALTGYALYRASTPGEALASGIRSLAVLPLENLSGDPGQEYFADGMTEALITELSKIGAIQVISRTSAMRYKGSDKPLPEIAEELGVTGIVEGSVVRSGDRVRITAQLIHAGTDTHLWAESYEGHFANVLRLQSEAARAIARRIELALSPEAEARLASADRVDPEAYEAYLKGRFHTSKFTPQDFETAMRYFQRALEIDPEYAPAWVGIGFVWSARQQMGFLRPREATPRAKAAVLKALNSDESLSEAHFQLAVLEAWSEWDWDSAERAFQRAIELNPNNADAHALYSHLLMIMNRPREALARIERAVELDPLNPFYRSLHGVDLAFARRYDDAIAQFRDALRISPGLHFAQTGLWLALHQKGMYSEALEAMKEIHAALGDREVEEALDRGFDRGGYRGAMRQAAETLAVRSRTSYVPPVDVAMRFLAAGDHERALEWLEKGYEERDPNLPYLGLPFYDVLRDDPRFQALVDRMGLPTVEEPAAVTSQM